MPHEHLHRDRVAAADRAWVALLIGNALNTSQLVQTQVLSVRQYSRHRHYTMVTPEIARETRDALVRLGSTLIDVEPQHATGSRGCLRFAAGCLRNGWDIVMTKLLIFNLTSADLGHHTLGRDDLGHHTLGRNRLLALLDVDTLLTTREADRVFDECPPPAELCAVRDAGKLPPERTRDMLNAGVMLVRPSATRFEALRRALGAELDAPRASAPGDAKRAIFPEQEFLTNYFTRLQGGGDVWGARVRALGGAFNSCGKPEAAWLSSLKAEQPELRVPYQWTGRILHHCGSMKLDWLPLCAWTRAGQAPPARCRVAGVAYFQQLLSEVNPCLVRSEAECASRRLAGDGSCHWCGTHLGCAHARQPCFRETNATRDFLFNKEKRARLMAKDTDAVDLRLLQQHKREKGANRTRVHSRS